MTTISTANNAIDSLTRMSEELTRGQDALDYKGVLYWGWHAVTLLAHHRLRPARESFDHWFWDYLDPGEATFDIERDARWEEKKRLSMYELLDILSDENLSILKPEFFQLLRQSNGRRVSHPSCLKMIKANMYEPSEKGACC